MNATAPAVLCRVLTWLFIPCVAVTFGAIAVQGEETVLTQWLPAQAIFFPSDTALSSLVPLPSREELLAYKARLDPTRDGSDFEKGLRHFAFERVEHLLAVDAALAKADGAVGEPLPPVEHGPSLLYLGAVASASLAPGQQRDLALALGVARLASGNDKVRRAGAENLRQVLEMGLDADYAVATRLALADYARRHADATAALEIMAPIAEGAIYTDLIAWIEADMAFERRQDAGVESRLWALWGALDRGRADEVSPALIDLLLQRLVRVGAQREGSWMRLAAARDSFSTSQWSRIEALAEEAYGAQGAAASNGAALHLSLAGRANTHAQVLNHLLQLQRFVVGSSAPEVRAWCLSSVEVLAERGLWLSADGPGSAFLTWCLDAYQDAPATSEESYPFFARIERSYGDLMRAQDKVQWALVLFAHGDRNQAVALLAEADVESLPPAARGEMAGYMSQVLYAQNADLHLGNLSCLRVQSPLRAGERRLWQWVGLSLKTADANERPALLEIKVALALLAADYAQAVSSVVALCAEQGEGRALYEMNRGVRVVEEMMACLETAGRWEVIVDLAQKLRGLANRTLRDEIFERVGERVVTAMLTWTQMQQGLGQAERAVAELQALQTVWRQNPWGDRLLFETGQMLEVAQRKAEAAQHYTEVAVAFPSSPLADDALYQAANMHLDLEQWGEAREKLHWIMTRYPGGQYVQRAAMLDAWLVARDESVLP